MRVRLEAEDSTLTYHFVVEDDDRPVLRSADGVEKNQLLGRTARYHLPSGWQLTQTHPDLLAAVAVAIVGDFTGNQLRLSFPVSPPFRDQVCAVYKWGLEPVDPQLRPRRANQSARMGLCFSAGVDSTAALSLLPKNAVAVFQNRLDPPDADRDWMYDSDAPLRACSVMAEIGREAYAVLSDMQHLFKRVGFVNDLSMSTPLMLLADRLNIDAMAYGMVLESSYLNKAHKFREYTQTRHWMQYSTVAAAVGLPWNLITAGLSEVVTTRLVMEGPLQHVAQSCVRGPFGAPCLNCAKCFRKSLLETTLAGDVLRPEVLDRYFAIRDAQKELKKVPIKHEDVLMFILQRYRGNHPEMVALREALHVDDADLGWIERWFSPAREVLADKYSAQSEASITRVIDPMNERDLQNVRNWDRIAAAAAHGRAVTVH
jgi:hypothetical protein